MDLTEEFSELMRRRLEKSPHIKNMPSITNFSQFVKNKKERFIYYLLNHANIKEWNYINDKKIYIYYECNHVMTINKYFYFIHTMTVHNTNIENIFIKDHINTRKAIRNYLLTNYKIYIRLFFLRNSKTYIF